MNVVREYLAAASRTGGLRYRGGGRFALNLVKDRLSFARAKTESFEVGHVVPFGDDSNLSSVQRLDFLIAKTEVNRQKRNVNPERRVRIRFRAPVGQ